MPVSRAHTLGDAQRVMDELVQDAAGRPGLDRERVGVAHLPENLRLADDHRVERGGDAEDVADGGLVRVRVEVAAEELDGDGAHVAQEVARGGPTASAPCCPAAAARTSTRLQVETINPSRTVSPSTSARRLSAQRLVREGEPLAHLDGRGLVVESDEND